MSFDPFLQIRKFWYADETRSTKKRLPGACKQLLNFAPNISDGLSVRRGYYGYGDVTFPNNYEILKTVPIQSPEQEDVHIFFCNDSGQKIKIQPIWRGTTKITDNINIAERITIGPVTGSIAANVITVNNAVTTWGMSSQADYYNGWMIRRASSYAMITDYSVSVDTATITLEEDVQTIGWDLAPTLTLYRFFHDQITIAPTYNTTKEDAPSVVVDNSVIRLSGGQSSAAGNKGIIIFPRLTRTWYNRLSSNYDYTYDGTYVSQRRLASVNPLDSTAFVLAGAGEENLPIGYTYWVGIAPVYDGYQIGELYEYENPSSYTGNGTDYNYTPGGNKISAMFAFQLGNLNKRITGWAVYVAQDLGQQATRKSPYFFVKHLTMTDPDKTDFLYDTSTGRYTYQLDINNSLFSAKGNVYSVDSGYLNESPDTMYSYSTEVIIGWRHYISNYYVDSESFSDKQTIITNPIGGNSEINYGAVQPDVFSNEEPAFRLRVEPTIGTKITGIVPLGTDEALIVKDRGLIRSRMIINADGTANMLSSVISKEVGCATPNGLVQADDGWIYFAGYEDIYRVRDYQYQPLIEREDANDWLAYYRGSFLTNTYKQNCTIWYLPQNIIYFDFGFNGGQFAYYPRYGAWMQVAFQQDAGGSSTRFFKWMTTLQDGTVLGTIYDSGGTLFGVMRFQDSSGAMYLTDNTTAIQPKLDTGDLIVTQDIAKQFLLDKITITRTFDTSNTPSGTLDCSLYLDGTLLKTYGDIMKGNSRIIMHTLSDDKKLALSFRLGYNTNASPEVLNTSDAEGQLAIDEISFYGEPRPRHESYAEQTVPTLSTGGGESVAVGLISGKDSVIVNSTPTAFTWDTPFTQNTTDANGNVIPAYRFWQIDEDDNKLYKNVVKVIAKTLTTITLQADEDNVLVRFRAEE